MTRLIGIFLIIGNLSCAATDSIAQEGRPRPPFNVGYRILDFIYQKNGQDKTLTVAVWYPTTAQPKPYNYGGPTSGMIAVDAAPLAEAGPYPMLVFSHGYGGSGLSAVFFTERLAAYGWIVAAPDHHDRYSAVRIRSGQLKNFDRKGFMQSAQEISSSGPTDRSKFAYRHEEMKLAIDRMVTSEQFRVVIDTSRIAVGGHSLGGFTALGLCGTIPERHDHRIKAVLLFSTGAGGYLFNENELARVRIPSMMLI